MRVRRALPGSDGAAGLCGGERREAPPSAGREQSTVGPHSGAAARDGRALI